MISKYTYLKDIKIIDSDGDKVLIKRKKRYDIDKIYKYLDDHNINNYLKPFKITDKELYFNYLNKKGLDNDEVAKHLMYSLSDLQNKTTIYKEIDKDKLKEEYDIFKSRITYLEEYYFTMQDIIENKVYMSPSEYLFIRNVSIIYKAINYSKNIVDDWYKIMKDKRRERYVYAHGKCELSHFIIADNDYFISLEKAHLERPPFDFINFFKKNFNNTDMISNFRLYQHRYLYKEEEYLYLLINITIPEKIDIYPSSLTKCLELTNFFDRLKLTSEFILKNKKDKKHYEKQ
jgi:hypothetical protein